MIQQEKILFVGGLNSDDEDRFLADGDYRFALNIRNSKTDKSSVGAIENTRGNTEITFTLPTGLNKCIGSKYDSVNNRIVFFIWNSLSSHSIYELNIGTQVVTLLLQNSVFNFNRKYPILHCDIIDDLCYWTDEFNPPRKINIARAKSGGYTTIDEQVISRIQYAPNYSPITQYGSDINTTFNKVRGKMFQFRYSFIYDDNEISAFSPISKIAIPPNQALYDFGGYYETTLDNHINVEFKTGNYLCKRIQLAVRESNTTDWALVKTFDKNELGINDDDSYIYPFYNNEVYIPITQASVNRLFDNVPLLSGAQSLIDGNRLVDSDVLEGYDNIVLDAEAIPVYNEYPPAITSKWGKYSSFPNGLTYTSGSVTDNQNSTYFTDAFKTYEHYLAFDPIGINPTNTINFTCRVVVSTSPVTNRILTFLESFNGSFPAGTLSEDIAIYFSNLITNSPELNQTVIVNQNYTGIYYVETVYIATTAVPESIGGGLYRIKVSYTLRTNTPISGGNGIPVRYDTRIVGEISQSYVTKTFKHNAKHSFALVYYDNPNRSGVCQVTDAFDVNVSSYNQAAQKGAVEMLIEISNTPPSWATNYQILYTGNRSVSSYLQIDTGACINLGNQWKIYINTIATYNSGAGTGRSNLSYSWAKGDRVTLISYGVNVFYEDFLDFEIISSTSDGGGQYIIIENTASISLNNGILIELYTPKLNQEQVFYWEIGEVYPIENGFHAGIISQVQTASVPAIIRVNSGDSYFRYRAFNTASFIEDYSLSDFYTSNSWDKGRFNVVDKEYKQIRRHATSFYSESFVPDTNINGLSTVYDTNFHEANKSYGAIQKTYAEQDRIYFFQQLRTGFSLVNKDVLYSSDGTPNGVVGQASQILSDVNYYIQDYGIGDNPESFAVEGTRKYHVDANKGFVLRLSVDGYTPISDYKYRNYFQDLFNSRKEINPDFLGKIFGAFDRRFDEYVLAFEECRSSGELEYGNNGLNGQVSAILIKADTVSFSEEKKRWVTHYSWKPDFIQLNGIDLVTWVGGKMYLHNSSDTYNNFYGVQYNSQIKTLSNQDPSNIKFYTSVYQESTDSWSMVATNQFGQETSLETTDFELNEGVYYAALLKDSNTPNLTYPLIEGDDMRCHSMSMIFTNTNTAFVKMFAVTVRFGYSEMTNK